MAVIAPSLFFLHRVQVTRLAGVFLKRAEQLEQQAEWLKASVYIQSYLQLRSDDQDEYLHLAETFGRTVESAPQNTFRAIRLYRQALGAIDDDARKVQLRRQLVPLLISVGRYKQAETELMAQPMVKESSEPGRSILADKDDRKHLAQALYGRYTLGAIDGPFDLGGHRFTLNEPFEQALELSPDDHRLAVTLAWMYRDNPELLSMELREKSLDERGVLAEQIVKTMIDASGGNADARLATYRYRLRFDPDHADTELDAAFEADPSTNVLLALAERAVLRAGDPSRGDTEQQWSLAESWYQEIIERAPTRQTAYQELGNLYLARGDGERAMETWSQGSEALRHRNVSLLVSLIDLQIDENQLSGETGAVENLKKLETLVTTELAVGDYTRAQQQDIRRLKRMLDGKLRLAENKPGEAVQLLQMAVGGLDDTSEHTQLAVRGHGLLATAYSLQRKWDLAAAANEEVARRMAGTTTGLAARSTSAESWLRAGQPRRAVGHAQFVAGEIQNAEAYLRLARCILADQLDRLPTDRDWRGFERTMSNIRARAAAEPEFTNRWRVEMLEADYALVQFNEATDEAARTLLATTHRERLGQLETTLGEESPVQLLEQMAVFYEQFGFPQDADRIVHLLTSRSKTDAALVSARLDLGRGNAESAKATLAKQIAEADPADVDRLRSVLAELALSEGNASVATAELRRLNQTSSAKTSMLVRLAEIAMRDNDMKLAEQCERELQQLEKETTGVMWKVVRAQRLLTSITDPTQDDQALLLHEAVRLQSEIARVRPEWSQTYFLAGILAQFQGHVKDAITAYQRAIDLGERRAATFEQLARLLYIANRHEEAEAILARMGNRVALSTQLSALDIMTAANRGDLTEAIRRAEEAVRSRPDDPIALLHLGEVLAADGQTDRAEQQFQAAPALAPENEVAWKALINFYLRFREPERARDAIQSMKDRVKFNSESDRELLLAYYSERLGDSDEAAGHYARAGELSLEGDENKRIEVMIRNAGFDLNRGDVSAAIGKLEMAHRVAPANPDARRALASALVARGEPEDFDKALQLVPATEDGDATDRRLYALLLARTTKDNYADNVGKAIDIYEQLVKEAPVTDVQTGQQKALPGDRLMLARLYWIQSVIEPPANASADEKTALTDRDAVIRQQYLDVISRSDRTASQVAAYIGYLVTSGARAEAAISLATLEDVMVGQRRNDPARLAGYANALVQLGFGSEADAVIRRLEAAIRVDSEQRVAHLVNLARLKHERKQWDDFGRLIDRLKALDEQLFATVDLEVRWLHARGKEMEIDGVLTRYVEKLMAEPANQSRISGIQLAIGNLLASLEMQHQANHWYRLLNQSNPRLFAPLALGLMNAGKVDEAIAICRQAAASVGAPLAATALASGLTNLTEGRSWPEAESLFQSALAEAPDDLNLLIAVANLRARQKRTDDAAVLYRRILEHRRMDVVTMNNLATLLSETRDKFNEALRYADYAIMNAGPLAALLDTKGTILLYGGRVDEASRLLRMACNAGESDPRYWFHLAVALEQQGHRAEAQAAFKTAIDDGVEKQLLTPKDVQYLNQLRDSLMP